MRAVSIITLSAILLTGCATVDGVQPGDNPAYAAATPETVSTLDIKREKYPSGSLYSDATSVNLYETVKAKRVGDIVTIVLNERTQGVANSRTQADKETDVTIVNPQIFGNRLSQPSKTPFLLNASNNNTGGVLLSSQSEFEGQVQSNQNNQLIGSISVTVSEVMSNGNLVVRGEKWLNITAGREFIRLKGIIRPQDIAPDNTISSLKVADAQITYSGSGQNHDSNVMGWLTKFFTSALWLL